MKAKESLGLIYQFYGVLGVVRGAALLWGLF
jgi:hypothetical protein